MKIKYFSFIIILSLFFVVGCEDLDTEPKGDTITSKQKEEVVENDASKAEAGVNAIFAQFSQYAPNKDALNRTNHHDIGYPSVMMFTDMNGHDVISDNNGYNWMGEDLSYEDRINTSRGVQIIWNDMYKIIRACNNVIGAIDPETEDPTSQYYLAQGLTVRAYSYFILAQLFQFNYADNMSEPCVPIITNDNADAAAVDGAPRSTVKEVYTLIQSDITSAIDYLKSAETNGITRPDKRYVNLAVAYGLSARVHLTMENWAEAATAADNAITASIATPAGISDVNKPAFWTATEDNWMWGIIINETDDVVTSGIVNWISHVGSMNNGYASYSGGWQINKKLFASIPTSDVRKGWWLDGTGDSPNLTEEQAKFMADEEYNPYTQVKFAPYNNVVGNSTNANDIPLMRIEEMYLIKAEAEAMSGGNGKTTLENFIKTYRDPDYVCNATDIQKEVYRHRRIELWGEGLSWYDIMRLETGVDRRGAGYPNASMVFDIEPGSDILLWRIPEAEIQANPMISEGDNNPQASLPVAVPDN